MADTRMILTTEYEVVHRVSAATDMPEHDVATIDATAQGLGGEGDFQIEGDSAVTYATAHAVFDNSESTIGSADCSKFLYIKNTGFTTSAKTTTNAVALTVGCGGTFANGGFTLTSGEAICLHDLGGSSDDLGDWQLTTASGNIYVEVVYHGG